MNILNKVSDAWESFFGGLLSKSKGSELLSFLKTEYSAGKCYPEPEDIFNAFRLCHPDQLSSVLVAQDPYHGPGQAHGLAFSVLPGIPKPPSLLNICKELKSDLGFEIPENGNLEKWAKQGVLLLNTTLTVREGQPQSHFGKGWETLTDHIIENISLKKEAVVFMLWGKNAQAKLPWIDLKKHLVLMAAHPSPLSANRGFFGCKHFSKANAFLKERGLGEIDWGLV